MNKKAKFSLGAVLRETEINPDTLRAWERRYDLPRPSRSEGGQRLYSERDIALIKWLLARTAEGMRIGQAVKLWKNKVAAGEDPLLQTRPVKEISSASHFDEFQEKWLQACVNFDEAAAEAIANEAFARFTPEKAFTKIFIPAIHEIGDLWYQGEMSVQQEHFASNLIVRRLDTLISAMPLPTRPEKVIIGCPPKEEHTIALRLVSLYLRRRGFGVIDLGANVPQAQLIKTVRQIKPTLVILAAQQLVTVATLAETTQTLDEHNIPTAYAGRVFKFTPELREKINGHFLGETLDEVFQNSETILKQKIAPLAKLQDENPYRNLLKAFDFYRSNVHVYLLASLLPFGKSIDTFQEANHFLSTSIRAALKLGNLDFLKPELDWAHTLIENHGWEGVPIRRYLQLYAQAAERAIGNEAAPLVAWLMEEAKS